MDQVERNGCSGDSCCDTSPRSRMRRTFTQVIVIMPRDECCVLGFVCNPTGKDNVGHTSGQTLVCTRPCPLLEAGQNSRKNGVFGWFSGLVASWTRKHSCFTDPARTRSVFPTLRNSEGLSPFIQSIGSQGVDRLHYP